MSIPTQGPVSFSEIQQLFGGAAPISFSEYYRGGANVPVGINTAGIPTSGATSVSQFKGKTPNADVVFEYIGGGGAGGFGRDDRGEEFRGTFGQSGTNTIVSGGGASFLTANGGQGGENCGGDRNTPGTAGQSSFYGSGGAGGARNQNGGAAPAGSFGAGGGGGGGDAPSLFDRSGCSGFGGKAGTRRTGVVGIRYGSTLSGTIGARGNTNFNDTNGGQGANGFARFNVDGVDNTFSTPGSFSLLI